MLYGTKSVAYNVKSSMEADTILGDVCLYLLYSCLRPDVAIIVCIAIKMPHILQLLYRHQLSYICRKCQGCIMFFSTHCV